MIGPFNPNALSAQRILNNNLIQTQNSFVKLATGLRINTGADDPAGLIAGEFLSAKLRELEAESRALDRAEHVATTADGAIGEVSELLGEARALVVANANGGLTDAEREANQMELDSILSTVDRIAGTTQFNSDNLLDGSADIVLPDGVTKHIDSVASTHLGESEIDGETYRLSDLGSGGALNAVSGDLSKAQQVLDAAHSQVARQRGELGAFTKNTIRSRQANVGVAIENVTSAVSAIRDTDFAFETSRVASRQLLAGSSLIALKLSNFQAGVVLRLVG